MALLVETFFTPVEGPTDYLFSLDGRHAARGQEAKLAGKVDMAKTLSAKAAVFVPVKRYPVAELLRLRKNASNDIEVDVHHIEDSIVSARQRATYQSPIQHDNVIPTAEPLNMPLLFPPHQANSKVKEAAEHESKDSDSARSASPTINQLSSEDESEQKEEGSVKVKKVHRSRRGGKRHPNKNKQGAAAAAEEPSAESHDACTEEEVGAEVEGWRTVSETKALRANKNRCSKAELVAQSGEAFSSAVMRRRRLQNKK